MQDLETIKESYNQSNRKEQTSELVVSSPKRHIYDTTHAFKAQA